MKKLIILSKLLMYYILGVLLFNLFFTITEVIIANILSLDIYFIDIYIKNIYNNYILYTILYFILLGISYCINICLVNKLNQKLRKG